MISRDSIRKFSAQSAISALSVFQSSCYKKVDYKISEEANEKDAVLRFSAFNVGCLAVADKNNKVVGVVSERDYINKVAAFDKYMQVLKVKDICTYGPNIIVAKASDSLDTCMNKMMFKDIRHLLIVDDENKQCVGMISIKDLTKEVLKHKSETITRLSDFHIGKGGFFGSE
jgi:predicted transcriptional regulator